MLSRVASNLYWMSRWIERGESLARMLDAHYRHSLLPHTPDVVARDWHATLTSLDAAPAALPPAAPVFLDPALAEVQYGGLRWGRIWGVATYYGE
jgi:hypothetical protein